MSSNSWTLRRRIIRPGITERERGRGEMYLKISQQPTSGGVVPLTHLETARKLNEEDRKGKKTAMETKQQN